jgi:leucine dehydrogenase
MVMRIFTSPAFDEHEQVVFASDAASGLRAIIALHDTSLGPAAGGCRMWPYPDEQAALTDALRLSRGMTYKSAAADLDFGGGKAVIIGDPKADKTPELFQAFGRVIEGLGGRYITAEDVGTAPADMDQIGATTRFVLGRTSGGSGDPSPMTARGVWLGIRAAVRHRLGTTLNGIRVAVQGLGQVGYGVARLLREDGAELLVADLDPARVDRAVAELGARAVGVAEIVSADAEVLAPCALGGVINDETLPRLRCAVVAGAANNQLLEERHGVELHQRGILYAPDYVINAGGIISIVDELAPGGYRRSRALERVEQLGQTLEGIFAEAAERHRPTHEIADERAERRLAAARAAELARRQRPAA